jgi:hypothetical protein
MNCRRCLGVARHHGASLFDSWKYAHHLNYSTTVVQTNLSRKSTCVVEQEGRRIRTFRIPFSGKRELLASCATFHTSASSLKDDFMNHDQDSLGIHQVRASLSNATTIVYSRYLVCTGWGRKMSQKLFPDH